MLKKSASATERQVQDRRELRDVDRLNCRLVLLVTPFQTVSVCFLARLSCRVLACSFSNEAHWISGGENLCS